MVACVHAVMDASVALQLPRVALCGLGTGVGWPQPESARLIVRGLREWYASHPGPATPTVVLFDLSTVMASAFCKALRDAAEGTGTGPAQTLRAAPAPLQKCSHQWMRQDGAPGVIESGKWVPYDYHQNLKLEQAWAKDPRGKVVLVDGAMGKKYVGCRGAVPARAQKGSLPCGLELQVEQLEG
jgi:hypothetical protein